MTYKLTVSRDPIFRSEHGPGPSLSVATTIFLDGLREHTVSKDSLPCVPRPDQNQLIGQTS